MHKDATQWNKITGIDANRLAETNDLTRDQWLAIRKTGIGGSDISAIAGLNKFKSGIDVFLEKTGKVGDIDDNEKMKWGRILEDPVAEEYADSKKVRVTKVNAVLQDYRHKFCLANIDRLIVKNKKLMDPEDPTHHFLENYGNGILEVKTTGWGQSWDDEEIPPMYYCQLMWYMHITGLKWGQFAVLIQGNEFISPEIIPYNPEVGANLEKIAIKFWTENIMKDIVPDVDQSPAVRDSMRILYPNVEEVEMLLPTYCEDLIIKRMQLANSIKTAEMQKKVIDAKILSEMQNAKWGFSDKHKVTRILRNNTSFNKKQFKEDNPDTYAKYLNKSQSIYPKYSIKK